jgi:16S rRNA (cytosine967-C5)-methyltransferase
MAGARPGERVLDACASPGGKTTALAACMEDRGLLAAVDVRPRRVALLRQTVRASRAHVVRVVRADVRQPLPFAPGFDLALLDAPCSGLGTLRRDPDIRWRRTAEQLAPMAESQFAMLGQVAAGVRPGGRVLYATCSSEPEENDQVVDRFLEAHPDYAAVDPRQLDLPIPAGVAAALDPDGRLRTRPWRHGLDAFFGAMLMKHKNL